MTDVTRSEKYSKVDIPLFPGTLRGYRTWGIGLYRGDYGLISAIGINPTHNGVFVTSPPYRWIPGVNVAGCGANKAKITILNASGQIIVQTEHPPEPHYSPGPDCYCGFYGIHDLEYMNNVLQVIKCHAIPICGSVKASGRILLGTQGFRAERAEVEALCMDSNIIELGPETGYGKNSWTLGRWMADRLKVPFFDSREELAEAFPLSSVAEFLEEAS